MSDETEGQETAGNKEADDKQAEMMKKQETYWNRAVANKKVELMRPLRRRSRRNKKLVETEKWTTKKQ